MKVEIPEVVFPEDEQRRKRRTEEISLTKIAFWFWFVSLAISIWKKGCLFWILVLALILVIIFM